MMKMILALDSRMQKKVEDKNIALANFIEALQKQADEEKFSNKLNDCLMIAVSYIMKRKFKKIFFEAIFN